MHAERVTQENHSVAAAVGHFCGDLSQSDVGQTATVNGWVSVNRDLGGIVFVEVRDRNDVPVVGAVVTFRIGGNAATFGGGSIGTGLEQPQAAW